MYVLITGYDNEVDFNPMDTEYILNNNWDKKRFRSIESAKRQGQKEANALLGQDGVGMVRVEIEDASQEDDYQGYIWAKEFTA